MKKTGKSRGKKPFQLTLIGPEPVPKAPTRPPQVPEPEPPTLPEWRALYAAAARFKELGSWDWMYDSDMFGVKDPETGVVGYCSVMGRLGQHFALAAYLGTKGLAGYLKVLNGEAPEAPAGLLELHECLMASFEDRKYLDRKDHNVIRELGLKFRGANAWSLFRRYRRGYLPWFMSGPEVRFLTTTLDQAVDVTGRFRTEPDLLRPGEDNRYLVRTSRVEAGELVWQDERLEPEPLTPEELAAESGVAPLPRGYAAKLRRATATRQGVWELDISHFPEPVQAGQGTQPYFPKQFLIADSASGYLYDVELGSPDNYIAEFRTALARVVRVYERLPTRVIVQNDITEAFIQPICSSLQIPLERGRLKAVREFRRGLDEALSLDDH